jgi:hypothetical protein
LNVLFYIVHCDCLIKFKNTKLILNEIKKAQSLTIELLVKIHFELKKLFS